MHPKYLKLIKMQELECTQSLQGQNTTYHLNTILGGIFLVQESVLNRTEPPSI